VAWYTGRLSGAWTRILRVGGATMSSILFAAKVYLIGAVISFGVAGLIKLLYVLVHRSNDKGAPGGENI